ncbi:MAG: ATP-grasp domain-containing protein, partial [Spirochaetales bacterium]
MLQFMTIGILYNISPRTKYLAPGLDLSADSDIEATVRAVKAVFEKDNQVILIQISDHTYDWLRRKKPDVLFNICEGFGGDNRGEIYVAALLEQAGIPFTGSDFFTLALCMDKERTKEILSFNGVPTPKFQVFVTAGDPLDGRLRFPLIVKPAREDASLGIGPDSVVYDENALRKKAGSIIETFGQPAMAEEYVDGRELNISVIGNGEGAEVLPVSEIIFDIPPDRPKIVDYDAKWVKDSPMYTGTSGVCPAGLEESLLRKVGDTALKAYRVMGVRDYGRVDIRLKGDVPYVIEVNPNPGKYVDTGFIRSARAAGYSFEEICRKILNLTLERSGLPALSAGTAASAAAPAEEHTVGTDRVFAVRAGGEHV